ncbi:glyoxalase/bleomycin resistance/dioxygenase family protein [soil metagenome]
METPTFKGGYNIALKIPKYQYEKTLRFYREVLGLDLKKESDVNYEESYSCRFGPIKLWLDRVDNYSKTDVWLELETSDMEKAKDYLQSKEVHFRSELEKLPADLNAHWISDPAGVVFLLKEISEKKLNEGSRISY